MSKSLTQTQSYTVMLGFPNAGKTTLFNSLTGSRQKVVNYPGSTVDFFFSTIKEQPSRVIIDTPGLRSFHPDCVHEQLSLSCLDNLNSLISSAPKQPDLILAVVDATQCQRQLPLVRQLKDLGYPLVVALSMMDEADAQGIRIDADQLSTSLVCPVIPVSVKKNWELQKLNLACSYQLLLSKNKVKPSLNVFKQDERWYFKWSEATAKKIYSKAPIIPKITQRLDTIFLNPIFGFLLFFTVMSLFFCSLFLLASPFISLIDLFFSASSDFLLSWLPAHWISSLFIEGGLGGVGAIFVFIPQIALLFFGLGLLESSGYLSRAAVIIDKPLSLFGFSGKSFIPLLSGCACAIPALLATRTISDPKERFLCQWIIPLMQCSARLPVYGLLLALLFPGRPLVSGIGLAMIYIASLVLAAVISVFVSKFSSASVTDATFCLELPPWRRPQFRSILLEVWHKSKSFVLNAGPLILIISFVLWFIASFPSQENSIALWLGPWIEPLFQPLGLDWRCGVAILLSFAAREVFASVLAVMFASGSASLFDNLANAVHPSTGELLFTPGSILSLLVFFMIALQCGSTVAVAKREMNSAFLPWLQVGFYFVLAYGLAFMVQLIF
ncbi:MAG: ferrous iron transporter B [bacterium]